MNITINQTANRLLQQIEKNGFNEENQNDVFNFLQELAG